MHNSVVEGLSARLRCREFRQISKFALHGTVAASAIAALLSGGGTPVLAQDATGATAGNSGLEEIIVTARRREESLQDVPVSITAVGGDFIENHNFNDLTDVSHFAPNLIFDAGNGNTGGSSNSQIFIRGIGQTDFLFSSDPGVGIYIDEVYFPRSTGSVMDVLDLERVEVLRGPQGTLFGKNTIGGAILLTSKMPTGATEAEASVETGSRDRIDAKGMVNLPLIENQLNARFSVSLRNQDGYVKRVNAGDTIGNVDSLAGRMLLDWKPSEGWDILFSLDGTKKRENSIANEIVEIRAFDPNEPGLFLWNFLVAPAVYGPTVAYDGRWLSPPRQTQGTGPNISNVDMWGASLKIEHDIGNLTLKSITAYRDQESEFGMDQDHSPLRYLETTNDNRQDQFSQEFQIAGTSGRFDWTAGVYYFQENGHDLFDVALAAGLYDALEALPGAIIPLSPLPCPTLCLGGAANPLNVLFDLEVTWTSAIDIDSYSGYAQGSYKINDKLSLTGGLRYTDDKKAFSTTMMRNASGVLWIPPTTLKDSWDALSARAGVEFKQSDNLMLYASAARGFKSGGYNGRAQSILEVASFDPEYVWTYEGGFKTDLADGRLRLNGAIYFSDYTDMQLTIVQTIGGLLTVTTENAGEAEVKGFELELTAMPAPDLLIQANLGMTDAEYTKLNPGATVTTDHKFPKVPKWTGSAAIQYGFDIGEMGRFLLTGDLSYRSSYFVDPDNTPEIRQGSGTALLGLRGTYVAPSGRWEISVYGTNITDERYRVNGLSAFGFLGTGDNTFGRPAEWGIAAKVRM